LAHKLTFGGCPKQKTRIRITAVRTAVLTLGGKEGHGKSYYWDAKCLEREVENAKENKVSLAWAQGSISGRKTQGLSDGKMQRWKSLL
jgi:hypothetical protein